jgi:hypothetical protein
MWCLLGSKSRDYGLKELRPMQRSGSISFLFFLWARNESLSYFSLTLLLSSCMCLFHACQMFEEIPGRSTISIGIISLISLTCPKFQTSKLCEFNFLSLWLLILRFMDKPILSIVMKCTNLVQNKSTSQGLSTEIEYYHTCKELPCPAPNGFTLLFTL